MLYLIATGAIALGAVDIKHIELADEVAEYDCAVVGHHTSPDGLILGCTVLIQ